MLRFAGDDLVVVVERDARVVDPAGGGERALELTAGRVIDLAAAPPCVDGNRA